MWTRFPALLLGLVAWPGCGEEPAQEAATPLDAALAECLSAPQCTAGEACLGEVCVAEPARAGALGGTETNAQGEVVAAEDASAPVTGCWKEPEPASAEPATVTLGGRVRPLESGGTVQGLCVTVYDAEALVEHLRGASRCPGIEDATRRARCFAKDGCICANEIGPRKTECEADSGPELGHALVARPDGEFTISGVPSNRPLAVKVSGGSTWRPTWTWGPTSRTDRLTGDDRVWVEPRIASETDWTVLPQRLGVAGGEQTGLLAGEVLDCGASGRPPRPVIGAALGLVGDAAAVGFHDGSPTGDVYDVEAGWTANQGRFAAAGLPAGANRLVAAVRIGEQVRSIGEVDLYVVPGAVAWIHLDGRVAWAE